jgi:hypothetical protein
MINEVVIEGIVVKIWKYADDLLFRIASYRDPDLPRKGHSQVHDSADFVTIRVIKGNLGAPVSVDKGSHVRIHGFIQSRDYNETLSDFLKDARGAELEVPENLDPKDLRAPRATTEVIARRIMAERNGNRR